MVDWIRGQPLDQFFGSKSCLYHLICVGHFLSLGKAEDVGEGFSLERSHNVQLEGWNHGHVGSNKLCHQKAGLWLFHSEE